MEGNSWCKGGQS